MSDPSLSQPADDTVDPSLVETLRREVVATELQILELKDRMLAVNTDRADAVALLGQAELLLEEKISYIITLDQALNARVRELEKEADRKTEEIDRRGDHIREIEARKQKESGARDAIIADLGQRLEAANQEINRVHELARNLDQKRATAEQSAAEFSAQIVTATHRQSETTEHLTRTQQDLDTARAQIADLENRRSVIAAELVKSARLLQTERTQIETISSSMLWRLGRPWRALFGPKIP
jgi:chromosome segregation ATPase